MDKDVKGLAFAKTVPETSNPVTNFPEEPRFQLLPPFFAAQICHWTLFFLSRRFRQFVPCDPRSFGPAYHVLCMITANLT